MPAALKEPFEAGDGTRARERFQIERRLMAQERFLSALQDLPFHAFHVDFEQRAGLHGEVVEAQHGDRLPRFRQGDAAEIPAVGNAFRRDFTPTGVVSCRRGQQGDVEDLVERQCSLQALRHERLRLDGDDAPLIPDGPGQRQHRCPEIGAHVDDRIAARNVSPHQRIFLFGKLAVKGQGPANGVVRTRPCHDAVAALVDGNLLKIQIEHTILYNQERIVLLLHAASAQKNTDWYQALLCAQNNNTSMYFRMSH